MDWSAGLRTPRGAERRLAGVLVGRVSNEDSPVLEDVGFAKAHLAIK